MKVFYETWTESERGWGTRPDGCSLHIDKAERDRYVKEYWDKQPSGEPPDEYSRPDGGGEYIEIPDDHPVAIELNKKESLRFYQGGLRNLGISVQYRAGYSVEIAKN